MRKTVILDIKLLEKFEEFEQLGAVTILEVHTVSFVVRFK